jgi:hypothetical protein
MKLKADEMEMLLITLRQAHSNAQEARLSSPR